MWFFRPAACFSFTDSLYNTPTSLANRNNHIHNIQPDIRLSVKDFLSQPAEFLLKLVKQLWRFLDLTVFQNGSRLPSSTVQNSYFNRDPFCTSVPNSVKIG